MDLRLNEVKRASKRGLIGLRPLLKAKTVVEGDTPKMQQSGEEGSWPSVATSLTVMAATAVATTISPELLSFLRGFLFSYVVFVCLGCEFVFKGDLFG